MSLSPNIFTMMKVNWIRSAALVCLVAIAVTETVLAGLYDRGSSSGASSRGHVSSSSYTKYGLSEGDCKGYKETISGDRCDLCCKADCHERGTLRITAMGTFCDCQKPHVNCRAKEDQEKCENCRAKENQERCENCKANENRERCENCKANENQEKCENCKAKENQERCENCKANENQEKCENCRAKENQERCENCKANENRERCENCKANENRERCENCKANENQEKCENCRAKENREKCEYCKAKENWEKYKSCCNLTGFPSTRMWDTRTHVDLGPNCVNASTSESCHNCCTFRGNEAGHLVAKLSGKLMCNCKKHGVQGLE